MNEKLDVHGMNAVAMQRVEGKPVLDATETHGTEDTRILLDLLNSVERDGGQSQRRLASELDVALGLVNAYLRRCVKKGLVKVTATPARRYMYYLTPQGFAEKSRLTVEYLSVSFGFFRRAKAECGIVFRAAAERGFHRLALAGISDLAEIAMICALDTGVKVTAMVDDKSTVPSFFGVRLASTFDAVADDCDAVLITDLRRTAELTELARARFEPDRVLTPSLLLPPPRAVNGGGL
ncbi:MAG: winged helix-turn-helix transcriptional regulator [Xanthobacteraceae bacterium]